jgi:hypothetical protein
VAFWRPCRPCFGRSFAAGLLGALIFVLLVFSLVKVVLHFVLPGG